MAESDDGTPRPPLKYEERVSGEMVSRTAAHEAGHILPAWLSWAVASVDGTFYVPGENELVVEVRRTYRKPYLPAYLWEALVISSGGMAGEAVTHMTFRTRMARIDLEGMRTQVGLIAKHFGASARPPWPHSDQETVRAPPFESYFKDGLPDGGAELMRSAYRRARHLILTNRGAYERLRTAMLVKVELSTAEIEAALRLPKA